MPSSENEPKKDIQEAMDRAADEAEKDLQNLSSEVLLPMANWMKKWYLKAGYKRLGKILVSAAGKGR